MAIKYKIRNTNGIEDILNVESTPNIAIPKDPANRHYQAILEWVEEGNTIEEAD